MNCKLRIEVIGDESRGRELLELITDETGVGYEPDEHGGQFIFSGADAQEVCAGVTAMLDRETDDWHDHLSL